MLLILLWLVLVIAAAAMLGYLARNVYRKAKALMREAAAASDRLGAAADAIDAAPPPGSVTAERL